LNGLKKLIFSLNHSKLSIIGQRFWREIYLENRNKPTEETEQKAWFQTLLITGVTAVIVFIMQNLTGRIFNPAFEICIIYVPAFVSLFMYLRLRISTRRLSH